MFFTHKQYFWAFLKLYRVLWVEKRVLGPICSCHLRGEMEGVTSPALILTPGVWGGLGCQ